jgi:NAD-dependent dihydropyrimidine dehydrogenase PreA subunit
VHVPPRNVKKVRRATVHPKRPGEECKAEPGAFRPVIDLKRCEGKEDCAEVCPYGVFAIGPIRPEDYAALGFFGKLKSRVHGGSVAHVVHGELCQACGLCVVACPEKAIKLLPSASE